MVVTLEQALDILEINDITTVKVEDLPKIEKKAKKRWHPDTIAGTNPSQETVNKYEENFKAIEGAATTVYQFLKGEYQSGEKVKYQPKEKQYQEPEEIIRQNAKDIQQTLRSVWQTVKDKSYKKTVEEVVLSPGDKLKDLFSADFKDHTSFFAMASFFYSLFLFLFLFLIGLLFKNTGFGQFYFAILYIWLALQTICCFLGLLPLSRLWLPEIVSDIMVKFINFGIGIYHWYEGSELSDKWYFQILFNLPILIAKAAEYIILFPIYEIAKLSFGEKVVRRVVQNQTYYAGGADWYIETLMNKVPNEMTHDELFHLSHFYSELSDVKAKT